MKKMQIENKTKIIILLQKLTVILCVSIFPHQLPSCCLSHFFRTCLKFLCVVGRKQSKVKQSARRVYGYFLLFCFRLFCCCCCCRRHFQFQRAISITFDKNNNKSIGLSFLASIALPSFTLSQSLALCMLCLSEAKKKMM